MSNIIRKIALFSRQGDKRELDLHSGVNLITGDSKTGKSALIEIVDFCLFSSRSSIPKGIITDFCFIYSVIYQIGNKFVIVGRYSPDSSLKNKVYVEMEYDDFVLSNFNLNYFDNKCILDLKIGQAKFEEYLGLSVEDISLSNFTNREGKSSIRSSTSLLFQHQNLVASKHAIFHRFENNEKKEKTIRELPVFLGWADGKYYSAIRELEELSKNIRKEENYRKKSKKTDDEKFNSIFSIISNYLDILGEKIPSNINFDDLLKLSNNLPAIMDSSYSQVNAHSVYNKLEQEIESLRISLAETENKIQIINSLEGEFSNYSRNLVKIKSKLIGIESDKLVSSCPLCKSKYTGVTDKIDRIKESRRDLFNEVRILSEYCKDKSGQLDDLISEKQRLKRLLRIATSRMKEIENENKRVRKDLLFRDRMMTLRGRASAQVEEFLQRDNLVSSDTELLEMKEREKVLKETLSKYDLERKYQNANDFISNEMTEICSKLDFEIELKPTQLKFDLRSFDFYTICKDDQVIRLYEMGSGANWLACHLSLFLSLLYLGLKDGKSNLLNFLFLDQPSQVYFPSGNFLDSGNDDDISQVQNIFNVILLYLDKIHRETGREGQVIILEHADNLTIDDSFAYDFESIVVARWNKSTNSKLI